jgi:hypothetical protein
VTAVSCISPGRQRSLTSNSNIPLEKGRVAGVLVILQKKIKKMLTAAINISGAKVNI